MRKLLFFIPVIVFFSNCNTPSATTLSAGLLSADSLPIQNFVIDINKDTLLHTSNGTWIKIDKGTFSSGNGKAALEIKEAITMQQIIKAGLVTQSNGQPLASGGMIYINAAAGQTITINKPFKVAVPSSSLDKNMQLYKGETTTNGNINWKDPKALNDNLQMSAIKKGEILFQQKCASCHGIGKEKSGPDLANVWERINMLGEGGDSYGFYIWQHKFKKENVSDLYWPSENADTAHIEHLIHPPHPYICNLMALYNNQEVDLSNDLEKNEQDWVKIYRYIENESNRRNLPYPRHAYLDACIDSCSLYKRLTEELALKQSAAESKRQELIAENDALVKRNENTALPATTQAPPPPGFVNSTPAEKEKVVAENYTATYYEFTIETFGWYNIDMLLKQSDNIEESELLVRITGAYREKIKVYLIIPSLKVMLDGGLTGKNKDEYAFYNKDGTVPLPQNTRAIILALTEADKSIAYSVKGFAPQLKQSFDISLTGSTKSELYAAIENMGVSGLSIEVNNSKNAAAIKEADKTIEQLQTALKNAEKVKPTRCDCDCGEPLAVPMPATAPAPDSYP